MSPINAINKQTDIVVLTVGIQMPTIKDMTRSSMGYKVGLIK
jgi:hypothetical protein